MKLVPFEMAHLEQVVIAELDDVELNIGLGSRQIIESSIEHAMAMTGMTDSGKVVFIAGIHEKWPRVYEAWLFISTDFCNYKVGSVKLLKTLLYDLKTVVGYNRVQADVRADLTKNIDFVKFFGFKFEGPMLQYGMSGETYLRYALYGEK